MLEFIRGNLRESPRVICARFNLCSPQEEKQDGPLCGPCQLGVNLVKEYISKPDDELLGMLLKACESLPSDLQAPCKMAVTLVGKQMLEMIRGNLRESPRVICARFRLCSAQIEEKQDGPLCGPCQLGVNLVKEYISKPDDELLGMLLKACESLPSDLQAPCKMAVTLVGKQMLEFIRGNLRESPRVICARFGLCSPSQEQTEEEKNKIQCILKCLGSGWNVQKVLALVAKCKTDKKCYVKELGEHAADCVFGCLSKREEKQDTPLCAPCQLGVQLVKDYISKPDDELLSMLLKGCESLPSDLQAPCKMAVTLVGKQLLEMIRGNLRESPRVICSRFRLCSASEQVVAQIAEVSNEEKNKVQCVLKCLGSGWNVPRVLKLLAKCKANKACYLKEVGQRAAECIMKCF